jgi:hypothetical protein
MDAAGTRLLGAFPVATLLAPLRYVLRETVALRRDEWRGLVAGGSAARQLTCNARGKVD